MPHLSSPLRAAALAALVVALLAGCSGEQEATGRATGSSGNSGSPASYDAPAAGAGRDLSAADLARSSDDTSPVACSSQHTAETFAVREFPAAVAAKGYDDAALGRYVYRTCGAAYLRYLGGDDSAALRSLFSWAWFRPSEKAWDAGRHWYRCDLVGGPSDAKRLSPLPVSARGYLAGNPTTSPHQEWSLCARGTSFRGSAKVPCSTDHDWRAVTTIKLAGPKDPYPGDRVAQVRTDQYCSDSVRAYLRYPVEDFDYATTVFGKAEWQSGNRRSVCWARSTT